jgi:hypothetical protein
MEDLLGIAWLSYLALHAVAVHCQKTANFDNGGCHVELARSHILRLCHVSSTKDQGQQAADPQTKVAARIPSASQGRWTIPSADGRTGEHFPKGNKAQSR